MHKSEKKLIINRPIAFIGMPGCGKSTIGQNLSKFCGLDFIDSDALICEKAGCSIPEIFEKQGEAAFRQIEKEVILGVLSETQGRYVLSTGGGAVMTPEILEALSARTYLVYIKASVERLWTLLQQDGSGRPLLSGADPKARLETLLKVRASVYGCAHFTIDSDGSSVAQIVDILKEKIEKI